MIIDQHSRGISPGTEAICRVRHHTSKGERHMYAVRNWLIGGAMVCALATSPSICRGTGVPDSIPLDSLAQYYEKVNFNHGKHINLIKDCAECHHHTTGTQVADKNCVRCHKLSEANKQVACKTCHAANPFSAEALQAKESNRWLYHQDKPGLKGAYHQSCIGCHAKGKGPTGCKGCHALNKAGEALYNSGEFAPKEAKGSGKHGSH
jgi:hypothetical protein